MADEKKKKTENAENPRLLSRREFAIGSMAVIGTQAFADGQATPPLSEEVRAMKLDIEEMVRARMETRHVLDDDVKRVIDHAEKTGEKLYQPESDRLLSKLRVNNAYFYVEYSPLKEGYKIHSAYTHRFFLAHDKGAL